MLHPTGIVDTHLQQARYNLAAKSSFKTDTILHHLYSADSCELKSVCTGQPFLSVNGMIDFLTLRVWNELPKRYLSNWPCTKAYVNCFRNALSWSIMKLLRLINNTWCHHGKLFSEILMIQCSRKCNFGSHEERYNTTSLSEL